MGGETRGDVRPRVECPVCTRKIAVTFDSAGAVWVRSHVKGPGVPCPGSRRDVRYRPLIYPKRAP